jgi:methylenetetrahydrofolate dehydrogenase (NADP+)/methenyltetrahydrofolate cyclohydrolase
MQIIDGKKIAAHIQETVRQSIAKISGRPPGLAFICVGDDPASRTYVRMKKKACQSVGILSFDQELPANTPDHIILAKIHELNANPAIDGILVQLPLPPHHSSLRIMEAVSPLKDIDGFHPLNLGKLLLGETDGFFPCTPLGILTLLTHSQIPVAGKHVVIVGRSNIVGKPLAALLMQKRPECNATVTIAHSHSQHLSEICKSADILIAAIGKPQFITRSMVKEGAVVIDVGINRITGPDGRPKLVGDVDFDTVAPHCLHITPVPGGVGPMTIATLLANTWLSFTRKHFS